MKTSFIKYTMLVVAFLWSGITLSAQQESSINILTQPRYQPDCAGQNSTLSVIAEGENLSYKWFRNIGVGFQLLENGDKFNGAQTADLQIVGIGESMNLQQFICEVSNGNESVRTRYTAIRLNNLMINIHPFDQTAHVDDEVAFIFHATGKNITFQWQEKAESTWQNLTDAKGTSGTQTDRLALRDVTTEMHGNRYRCVVKSDNNCGVQILESNAAVLSLKEGANPLKSAVVYAPVILTNNGETVAFKGNNTVMTVNGSINNQDSNTGGGTKGRWGSNNLAIGGTLIVNGSIENYMTEEEMFVEGDKTTVKFVGSGNEEDIYNVEETSICNFYNIEMDRMNNGFHLDAFNTSISNQLIFTNGNFNLRGGGDLELKNIDPTLTQAIDQLTPMPLIINETNTNRITAENGFEVFMDVLVDLDSRFQTGYDLGNMGLHLQSLNGSNALGGDMLTIRRGHSILPVNDGSIERYYKVESSAIPANVAMDFVYFSNELNGTDFATLDFHHNPDVSGGSTFANKGTTSSSNQLGLRSLESPDVFPGLWTLSNCLDGPEVDFPYLFNEVYFCDLDGTEITLSADILPADDGSYTYLWRRDNVTVGNTATLTIPFDETVEFAAYTLIVENAEGCKGTDVVYVYFQETPEVDWSNEPTVQCDLSPYFISGDWGSFNASYVWFVNGENQMETSSSLNFMPPAAGTYVISLTTGYLNESVGLTCPETFTHTITFNEQPLSFSFPYEFEEVRLCGDEQVTLTPENITPADDGSYTYEWFTEDDPTILSTSPTLTVGAGTPYGDEQYLLRITTGIGCFDLQLVTVYTTPVADLDWSGLPTVQCDLNPYTIDADWGYEFAVYQWSVDNQLQPSDNAPQFTFFPGMGGTYEISVTTGEDDFVGGIICPTTFTHTITFSEEPFDVSFPYVFSEVDVCEAEGTFTLMADVMPIDDGNYTYSWTLGEIEVGTDPSYTVTFNPLVETEVYQLTVTTSAGCTDNDSVLVYHTESADVDWSALPETVCTLDPYTFNAGWGNAGAGFQWTVDEDIQMGETDSSFVFTPLTAGTYTISVITGEYGSIQYCPEQFTHTITFADGEQLADLPFNMTACNVEGGVTPVNLETPACIDCSYQWLDALGNPVGTDSNTYTVPDLTENTSYSVEVTKDGCTSTDDIQLFYYFATIDEMATVITNLDCDGTSIGAIDLVFDATEIENISFYWENVNAENSYFTEDLTDLATGTYSVTITDDLTGCLDSATFILEEPITITADFDPITEGVSCNNANDGFISINASGGTGILTYDWNVDTYDEMSEVPNLPPGMYSISVSDANGCPPVILDITFDNPTPLMVMDISINSTATAAMDGSIDITVLGGTPDYNYDWADIPDLNNEEDRTGLGAGTYTVIITDENDCEITEQYMLTEPGELSVTLVSITNIPCTEAEEGAIDISVNGGIMPYQFLWSNGAMTEDLTNVPAGDYTVMITDDNGIIFNSVTYTVNPPVFLMDNASVTQINCAGETGMIVLNPTGGTATYNYIWSNEMTTATISDLLAGDYTVTITTENDCPFTETYTINPAPTAITAAFDATTSDISCNNVNDGFILINASGGTGTLTYDWNIDTYDGMNEASSLSAGVYSISISDENNCPPVVLEITIENPEAITASEMIINPTTVGALDGEIDLTVSGGTPIAIGVYNFDWEDVAGTDNTEDRTGLAAGNYTVTITDANGCMLIEQYMLTAPGQISVMLESITNLSCEGMDDGAIDITPSGGIEPYTILWSNGAMTEDLMNVPAGDYTVMITDGNGVIFNSLAYTVNPPNFLLDNAIVTQIDCADGTGIIALSPTNGMSDYSYMWEHGPTTATIIDLAAGDYTVTISTENDCPFVGTYTINAAPTEISVMGSASGVCAGSTDGSIEIDVSGGTPDYSFLWTNIADNATVALTEDVMNLPAGDYQVEVTDANNCVATFDFNIPEYPALAGTAEVMNVSTVGATDGAIDLTMTGGTEAFTFVWSEGEMFMADTEDISDLSVGTYTVLVTDANGCTFTDSYTVNEPGALDIALNITQEIDCFGEETGQITATISGGLEPYTYAWSNGGMTNPLIDLPAGIYTLTATDVAGIVTVSSPISIDEPTEFTINAQVTNPTTVGGNDGSILTAPSGGEAPYTFNWSDGIDTYSTPSLMDISAGNYDLTVTDANGCIATDALPTYTLMDPNVLLITLTTSQNVSCPEGADGSLTVSASGGVEEYIFNWENAANPSVSIGATATIDALEAGTYNVTATDADGLMTSSSFDITQPDALVYNELINNVLCDDLVSGSITLALTGGTGTYTYLWSNESITASTTDLIAGDYSVTITDENDCTYSETFSIIPASLISAMETIINVNCNGDNTGSINLMPQGGGGTLTYLWSNEATTQNISQLTAGEYSVTISDGGECTFIETYTIEQPTALTASTMTMQATQPTTADGSIDLIVSGGTEPYSFLWSNEEITEDLENILPGTYSVTITDDNNCEFIETVPVTSPGGMSVIPTTTQVTCFGLNNGSISLEIEGGTMPFTILWSNDETTPTISDLEAGVYMVTVTDDTGFSINTSAEIIEPAEFSLTAIPIGVACNGDENGSINITTNNGQSPFDFVWSNEALTQNISELASGVYMVTATDDNGCIATQISTVATSSPLVLTVDVIENPDCSDDTNGTIFLSTTGGTGDYDYIWSNSETTEDIINLSPDTYLVTVTDENNCTAEMSYDVTAPLPLLITFDETNIACGGAAVGSITATVTGGTSAAGDYNLMWSSGEMTLTINDLMAGDYTLTAEDDNGCTIVESTTIIQTGSLVITENQSNITCFGEEDGLILVQVVGSGTAPFDYLWSNGEMTDLVTGLAMQDYTVTITDADGCEGVETYSISQPTPVVAALDAISASCFESEDGAIELTVTGGTLDAGSTYAYLWSNAEMTEDLGNLSGGEYTVTITDDNDCQLIETETVISPEELVINALQGGTECGNIDDISITLEVTGGTPDYTYNWDNGTTSPTRENLSEGTYMATVTDDNGCTQSITQSVFQPEPIVADAFVQRAGCKTENDGLIDMTATGGLAPYDFAWSNGSFEEDIIGLSAGNYSVTITDATNCIFEMNFEVQTAAEPLTVNFLVNSGLSETDTLQVNSSDIVQFIDITLPTPTAWEWSFGDPNNSTSMEQNPQFSYPFDEDLEQTEYTASLVASNEFCRDTLTKTILIINNFRPNLPTIDIGENLRFLNVNAYPNPTADVINLDIEMSKDAEVKIQIVDILGRVHEERILTEDDMYNTQLSLENLTNGVYYLHLSSADRTVTLGIVKVD